MTSDDEATAMALMLVRCFLELDALSRTKLLDFAEELARQPNAAPTAPPSRPAKLH